MSKKSILAVCTLSLLLGACGNSSKPDTTTTTTNTPVLKDLRDMQAQPRSETGRWFVEFEGEPGSPEAANSRFYQENMLQALGKNATVTQSSQEVFKAREVTQYGLLFNGVAMALSDEEVTQVRQMKGVKALYPVKRVQQPVDRSKDAPVGPRMVTAINQGGVKVAQDMLGLTGKGVTIAVVDSGVNINHPAFAGRIKKQWDFVGDDYRFAKPDHPAIEDPIADDCGGHGSHVAGIAAGNDATTGFKGVAPEADIYSYRVFSCAGSSSNEIILKAIEKAHADRADVVNLSLGSDWAWGNDPNSRAVNRMMEDGVMVVIAAGNVGAQGQYSIGSPATAEEPLSVAAAGNTDISFTTSDLLIDGVLNDNPPFVNVPHPSNNGVLRDFVLADPPLACNLDGAADPSPYKDGQYAGKTVVVDRGACAFSDKALNLIKAGARGMVIVNNKDDAPFEPYLGDVKPDFTYGMMSKQDGEHLKKAILDGKTVEMRLNTGRESFPNPEANATTDFSSVGDTPDLLMKPEIIAPGGGILSATPKPNNNGYVLNSGTSMATPFVAGTAALLLQKYPDLTPFEVRDRLMNTAMQLRHLDAPGKLSTTEYAHVQRQGAGMVDIYSAALNTVSASPAKLALGASYGAPTQIRSVELSNRGNKTEVFYLRHQPALAFGGVTNDLTPLKHEALMTVNGKALSVNDDPVRVSVPAGGKVELSVVIRPPADAPLYSQYGGWLVAENAEAHNTVVVPYSGFKGNYQARAVLGESVLLPEKPTPWPTPIFIDPAGEGQGEVVGLNPVMPQKPVFTFSVMDDGKGKKVPDAPQLLLYFAQPASRFILEAVDKDGKVVQTIEDINELSRSGGKRIDPERNPLFTATWNGKNDAGQDVSAGDYKLQIRILRILGNPNNPEHWETYSTPVFEVKR